MNNWNPKEIISKIKAKLGSFPIPAWLFAIVSVLYSEAVFHLWVADAFSFARFAAVLAFALGFGGIIAQIVSFLGHKTWGKWISVVLVGLVSAMCMVEYFINDAYQVFMDFQTLLSGAEGVATGFGDLVVGLVVRDFWRILVMLLPVFLYALFAKPVPTSWRLRWFGLVLAIAGYAGGLLIVNGAGSDASRLKTTYNFDSAIRCFGVNMGFTLDVLNSGENTAGGFTIMDAPQTYTPAPTAPAVQEMPEDPTAPTEVVYGPNIMDFDFAALAESETSREVSDVHKYVATVQPSMQNEYTGLFKGKNLIIVTAEAFSKEVIDPELTPTLYRLANEGIRFDDYYQPMWGGSTSSGEFSVLTGLVSASGTNSIRESRQQEMFLVMGKQLEKQGYFSAAYHNNDYTFYDRHLTHTYYGYETFTGMSNGMEEGVKKQWPASDWEMIDFTAPQYIDNQPFNIYYMTVSGHCRYNFKNGNKMSMKHMDKVTHLDYSKTVQAYLACQLDLEYAMASLVSQLEEAGIADDTVIVLTADHYPYGLEPGSTYNNSKDYVAELYGYNPKNKLERDHNALIIWSGCIEDMDLVVETPTYSLDILPTLSNLFGLEYDSRLLVGRDVFSEQEPIVLWYDYTWKTDKGIYDSEKGKFTPAEGVEVDEAYVQRIRTIVENKIYFSRRVQALDYYNYLWEDLQSRA